MSKFSPQHPVLKDYRSVLYCSVTIDLGLLYIAVSPYSPSLCHEADFKDQFNVQPHGVVIEVVACAQRIVSILHPIDITAVSAPSISQL